MSRAINGLWLWDVAVPTSRARAITRPWTCPVCSKSRGGFDPRKRSFTLSREDKGVETIPASRPELAVVLGTNSFSLQTTNYSDGSDDAIHEAVHEAASLTLDQIPNPPWLSSPTQYLSVQFKFGSPKPPELKEIRIISTPPMRGLSPFRIPPPGLDTPTLIPDRAAFAAAQYPKAANAVLRIHFGACQTATDVLRVVAAAMQRPRVAAQLPSMNLRIIQALFRSRVRASDSRVCSVIRMIINRLHIGGLPVPYDLYACGLKFAARSRRLEYMRWYLTEFRVRKLTLPRDLFRSVIAKLSIGKNGYGEIRNGKWEMEDLHEILFGFRGWEVDAHLESWLERGLYNWQKMHAWLQVLAKAGKVEEIWREWRLWRDSHVRNTDGFFAPGRQRRVLGSIKLKGDANVAYALCRVGNLERAWEVIKESPSVFPILHEFDRRSLMGLAASNMEVQRFLAEFFRNGDVRHQDVHTSMRAALREHVVIQKLLLRLDSAF
ncbi:hypothetical protein NA57DRAFT_51378 [Rhizodiscina lignyota]|uniref:Uncharacterized protein n=1 Tax=Rhizodiscina lignyota TaxID=1504668 RepID=A0A9P4ISI2_9PEZI|nr:hypothetical protein NA57DRAFT_51378 [Rhizodiscina lignyota]